MRDAVRAGAGDQPKAPAIRRRVAITFADQVVSSASNFITGVAIARVAGAVDFGEYTLVLTIWIILVGTHRRVITEPMIVDGRNSDIGATPIAHGLSAELLLGAVASMLTVLGGIAALGAGAEIGSMLLAISPWFVPLLIQDYWRSIAYQRRRPDLALVNDVAFAIAQVTAIAVFVLIGWSAGEHMLAAWGLGATVGALLGFRWFPTRAGWRDGWRLLLRLWSLGRWLLADLVTALTVQQGYLVAAALLLSKQDYGGFRAATSLMGPTIVIFLAAGNIGLPEVARRTAITDRDAMRRYVIHLSFWTACCVAAYGMTLAVAAGPLLRLLYGPEFARFAPLTILAALQYVVVVSVYGQGIALRATGWISRLWPARIATSIASLASLLLLVRWLGLNGVGWTGVATGAYDTLAVYMIYRRGLRRGDGGPQPLPSTPPASQPSLPGTVLPPGVDP